MKKIILLIFIIIAVPYLSWQIWLFVGKTGIEDDNNELHSRGSDNIFMQDSMRVAHFSKKGKSPLVPYKVKPKPKRPKKQIKKIQRKPKVEVKPPRIKVTGIMWNPSTPVAMVTLPNGTNTVAKPGQALAGGITVKKVEKNRIQVVYKGTSFWINR